MLDAPRPISTPFQRFSPRIGWPGTSPSRVNVPEGPGALSLAMQDQSPIAATDPMGSFGGRTLPRGVAIGADGRVFLADPAAGVILSAAAANLTQDAVDPFCPLWARRPDPDDAYALAGPTDLAFGLDGDLIIADPVAGKVLVIDWPSAAIRADLRRPGWRPVAVTVLACGAIIVADHAGRLWRFDRHFRPATGWPHDSLSLGNPSAIAAFADQTPLVVVLDQGRVVAVDRTGREVADTGGPLTPPAFQRHGAGLSFDDPRWPGRQDLQIADLPLTRDGRLQGRSLPVIALPRRIEIPMSGKLIFDAFNAGQRDFAWDRVVLDLTLPANSRIVLRSMTSNTEMAADRVTQQPDSAWSRPLTITPDDSAEALIQSGPGQFLWLWIDLYSDGTSSPQINRIDLHGPRRSGMEFLPSTFKAEPQSRDFLDRFLSYFDVIFAELRQQSRDMGQYFDPMAVPAEKWLAWLGSWFDLSFLAEWDVATRRDMVAHAIESARERGTQAGLARMLRWHLGLAAPWPGIIEHFRLGPDAPPIGLVPLPAGPQPHLLTIVLPLAAVEAAGADRLDRLIASWLPAHVGHQIRTISPGIIIGQQSTPGLDTYLGGSTGQPLGLGRAGLDLATAPPPRGTMISGTTHNSHKIGDCHVGQGH